MQKVIKFVAVILILAFTLFPAGSHIGRALTGQGGGAFSENRVLLTWPKWAAAEGNPANYTKLVSEHFNDHFGGRAFAIRARNKLSVMMGDGTASVLKGRTPGWYFYNNPYAWQSYEGLTVYNNADVSEWIGSLKLMQTAFEAGGAVFAAMIPPDKSRIYPEHTPLLYGDPSSRRFADDLVEAAKRENVPLLDINPAMLAAKKDGPVFYKTDTHWTRRGAQTGYYAAMRQFNKSGARFPVIKREDLLPSSEPTYSGDLAFMLGLKGKMTEPVSDYRAPVPPKKFIETVVKDPTIPKTHQQTLIFDNGTQDGTVLVIIGDSFSHWFVPYFQNSFDRVVLVHHQRGKFDFAAALDFKPDAVLFAPVEREAVRIRSFASKP